MIKPDIRAVVDQAMYARIKSRPGQQSLFSEEDHPRGQPGNAGQFAAKDDAGGSAPDPGGLTATLKRFWSGSDAVREWSERMMETHGEVEVTNALEEAAELGFDPSQAADLDELSETIVGHIPDLPDDVQSEVDEFPENIRDEVAQWAGYMLEGGNVLSNTASEVAAALLESNALGIDPSRFNSLTTLGNHIEGTEPEPEPDEPDYDDRMFYEALRGYFPEEVARDLYRKIKDRPGQKRMFDEDSVEREPAGSGSGGQFAKKGTGKKGSSDGKPKRKSKKRVGSEAKKPRRKQLSGGVEEDDRRGQRSLFDDPGDPGGERHDLDDPPGDTTGGGEVAGDSRDVPDAGATPKRKRASTLNTLTSTDWSYDDHDFIEGGKKQKFRNNIKAIRTMNTIETEGRTRATIEEQEVLSKFSGWGQFPQVFDKYPRPEWSNEAAELKLLLGDERYSAEALDSRKAARDAKRATQNSHFTDPAVVDAHWKLAQRLGFKGGKFLEPSVGSGHYLGMMPEELRKATAVTGVELDSTTARVARLLYPSANIHNQGFEQFSAPDGFYDLVASNVPFGDYRVSERRYNRLKPNIHDHFTLKSLDKAKPGGLVMHVTSTGTMDKKGEKIRKEIAKNADLIGAVRLPSGTHGQAAGTSVVTDMLVFRKRDEHGEAPMSSNPKEVLDKVKPGFTGVLTDSLGRVYHFVDGKRVPADYWTELGSVPDPEGGEDIPVNKYFEHNPGQILGQIGWTGSQYSDHEMGVAPPEDLNKLMDEAIQRMPQNVLSDAAVDDSAFSPEAAPKPEDVRDGNLVVDGDDVYQQIGDARVKVDVPAKSLAIVKDSIAVRGTVRELMRADLAGEEATELREKLGEAYDAFVEAHGPLHKTTNLRALAQDPDLPVMLALEDWDKKTKTATKADIFDRPTIRPHEVPTSADGIDDAYGISLAQMGRVNPDYMAQLTGMSIDEIENGMRESGIAFEDPSEGWTERGTYLSGDVKEKLALAREAAEQDGRYKTNVEELEKVQPEDIKYDDIGVRLGSPWIPTSDVEQFVIDQIGGRDYKVEYSPELGQWSVAQAKWNKGGWIPNARNWETSDFKWNRILDAALNSKVLTVWGKDNDGHRYVDVNATEAAREKVSEVKEQFEEWVWDDEDRRDRLARKYNDELNTTVPATYDGGYLDFPGMRPDWKMRDVQSNFVAQLISRGRGYLAHEVGIGKTATMVAGAMELKRLGLAKKPAIVVPKATLDQMVLEAQELYPGAKIISTAGKFDASNRKEWLSKMATGDYDMVIMSQEHMKFLPMERDTEREFLNRELDELESALDMKRTDGDSDTRAVKAMEKAKSRLEAKIKDVTEGKRDDALTFEQSGIDQLFVDEAHAYKNLPVHTALKGTKGIPTQSSQRATDMYMKANWLMKANDGRGVVFASGTPVSNTMAEVYNIQRFLQPEELEKRGLTHFDSWSKAFGDSITSTEKNAAGEYKDVTRFSKFTNVPELMQMLRQDLDVRSVDGLNSAAKANNPDAKPVIVRPERRDDVVIQPSNLTTEQIMSDIERRAKSMPKRAEKGGDNMVSLTTLARQAAVDPRLYDPNAPDLPDSKVNQMVSNVLATYHDPEKSGKTQLVFSDIGVNPSNSTGFHLYGDIIDKLVEGGIPREEIADFGNMTDLKKKQAAADLKAGKMRIGIGSTQKLGTGTNVQTHLAEMHHLDVPYVPTANTQRDGRGIRQGNLNKDVKVTRYVSEGSADEISWGIVGRKAAFIDQAVTDAGTISQREFAEEDGEVFSTQQLQAAAAGDTRILEQITHQRNLRKLQRSKKRHDRDQKDMQSAIQKNHERIGSLNTEIGRMREDFAATESHQGPRIQIEGAKPDAKGESLEQALNAAAFHADAEFKAMPDWKKRNPSYVNSRKVQVGTVRGMPIWRVGGSFQLEGESGQMYATGDTLRSIEYTARNIGKRADKKAEELDMLEQSNQSLTGQVGMAFRKQAELDRTQKSYDAVTKSLHDEPHTKRDDKFTESYSRVAQQAVESYMRRSGQVDRYEWITIGSDKSAPEGDKGGSPVFVGPGGTIEKGPDSLEGENLGDLDQDKEQQHTEKKRRQDLATIGDVRKTFPRGTMVESLDGGLKGQVTGISFGTGSGTLTVTDEDGQKHKVSPQEMMRQDEPNPLDKQLADQIPSDTVESLTSTRDGLIEDAEKARQRLHDVYNDPDSTPQAKRKASQELENAEKAVGQAHGALDNLKHRSKGVTEPPYVNAKGEEIPNPPDWFKRGRANARWAPDRTKKQAYLFDKWEDPSPESAPPPPIDQVPGAEKPLERLQKGEFSEYTGLTLMDIDDIKADATRFQYKVSGIGAGGVSQKLKDAEVFNPMLMGSFLVWHDPEDGETYVVNGHHRHELAQRADRWKGFNGLVPAYFVDAPDATTARAMGALANIADENGTATDAAKFIRDTGSTPEDMRKLGVSLRGRIAEPAQALSQVSDTLFHQLSTGLMKESRALAIANNLQDHEKQNQLVRKIDKAENEGKTLTDAVVAEMARQYDAAGEKRSDGGGGGLFGDDDFKESLIVERSELISGVRQALNGMRSALGRASTKRAAERLESVGGNVIDTEANKAKKAELDRLVEDFNSTVNYRGTGLSEMFNDYAQRLADNPRAGNQLRKELIGQIAGGGQLGGGQQGAGVTQPAGAGGQNPGRQAQRPGSVASPAQQQQFARDVSRLMQYGMKYSSAARVARGYAIARTGVN